MSLTIQQVEQALPTNLKSAATQEFTDRINNIVNDPIVAENIAENFISYAHVLKDGRFKTADYLNAVAYVSFKVMGLSNQEAYQRTFPQRYQALLQKGTDPKDIAAYVSAYNKGKLVNLILEQTLTPTWILNQHHFQKAINVQAGLMINAKSEKVRSDAANSLLTHLQKPKESGPLVSLEMTENSGMQELKGMLHKLAESQRKAIENGAETKDIAAQPLIEGKVKEL